MPASAQEFWSTHKTDWEAYWAGRGLPHRSVLLQFCQSLKPFGSVLEIGSGAGTNLSLIHDEFPWATLEGVDMHPEAVAFAREHLPDATIVLGDAAEDLQSRESQSVDVVFSCYTLSYIEGAQAMGIVGDMLRVARKAVAIVEPHMLGASLCWRTIRSDPHGPSCKEWFHDYFEMAKVAIQMVNRAAQLALVKVTPQEDALNAMTTVEFR